MELQVIVVRDSKGDCFGQPQFVPNVGSAVRSFGDEANNDKSPICRHPEDYALWHIGKYDDATGRITQFDDFRQLALATDYKKAV